MSYSAKKHLSFKNVNPVLYMTCNKNALPYNTALVCSYQRMIKKQDKRWCTCNITVDIFSESGPVTFKHPLTKPPPL